MRRLIGRSSAKEEILGGCFQKVVGDLVWSHRVRAQSARDRLRISAGACHREAVEVAEEGIDDRKVGASAQHNPASGLVLSGSMQPRAVDPDVVRGSPPDWLETRL